MVGIVRLFKRFGGCAAVLVALTAVPQAGQAAEFTCILSRPSAYYAGIAAAIERNRAGFNAVVIPGAKRSYDRSSLIRQAQHFVGKTGEVCIFLLMRGRIMPGDTARLGAYLGPDHAVSILNLQSPGGDLAEAMTMGRLLRRYLVQTMAPYSGPDDRPPSGRLSWGSRDLCEGPDCICASACVVVWAGGIERGGGHLGLHRASFADQAPASLGAAEGQRQYREVVRAMRGYFEEMEVSRPLAETMERTDSNDLVLAARDLPHTDIGPFEAPSFQEWMRLSCDVLTPGEQGEWWRLRGDYRLALSKIWLPPSFPPMPADPLASRDIPKYADAPDWATAFALALRPRTDAAYIEWKRRSDAEIERLQAGVPRSARLDELELRNNNSLNCRTDLNEVQQANVRYGAGR